MQTYEGLKARLIWDGGDTVEIPPEMGQPRSDQMQGTPAERLTELCGRVCYDSLGVGRSSADYFDHILGVGHFCYDGDTDVLTAGGWKPWADVTSDDSLATLNQTTHRVEYHKPIQLIRDHYRGRMYRVEGQQVDLLVTPEHKMWACRTTTRSGRRKEDYELISAAELDALTHAYMKGSCGYDLRESGFAHDAPISRDAMSLLGFTIGDGYVGERGRQVHFHLHKERKISWLTAVVGRLGFELSVNREDGKYRVALPESLVKLFGEIYDVDGQKQIPPFLLMTCSSEALGGLYEGLIAADGHDNGSSHVFDTTSRKLADQFQQLCLHIGIAANIISEVSPEDHKGSFTLNHTAYRLGVERRTLKPEFNKPGSPSRTSWIEKWEGDIYCAEVPNNTLYVRRNGKPVWSGNSIAEHFNATLELVGDFGPAHIMALTNRPWVWVTYVDSRKLRVTTNVRGAREWNAWNAEQASLMPWYPVDVANALGTVIRDAFNRVAPRIVAAVPKDEVWPTMKLAGLESASIEPPINNAERWVSIYMVGSRGFCYDSQTEVLTRDGWKAWPNVTGDEEFATMRMADGSLEYQRATDHIVEPYHGRMYRLSSQTVDLFVTPNHRMVVKEHDTRAARRGDEHFKILTAEDVAGRRLHYKRTAEWAGESPEFIEIPSVESEASVVNQTGDCGTRTVLCAGKRLRAKPFARFLGYWLAEGHLDHTPGSGYMTVLTQKEGGRAWDGMVRSITEMGLSYSINRSATCPQIRVNGGRALYEFLRPFSGVENKGIPQEVKNWAPDYQRGLIQAYLEGDGSFAAGAEIGEGHTVSRRLADDLQEAALKAGWSANIRIVDRREEDTPIKHRRVCYVIGFSKDRGAEPLVNHNGKKHDSWEHYSGMIYCVTVPNGTLYVRRNGKPCWSGNSHEQVRHGDFTAISQRSTRYCEESDSPWIIHPLIQEYCRDERVPSADREMAAQMVKDVVAKSRHSYRWWVDKLVAYVTPRLAGDPYAKTTARKQARGAARGLLGNALETEVIFSAAVFQWQHMFTMRCAAAADAEIRNEFVQVLPLLKNSRYGREFARFELEPAPDGIGMALVGGGHK